MALSRAFGDFQFKDQRNLKPEEQAVTCDPDITEFKRRKTDKFIILACDGIWDCLTNEEAVKKMEIKLAKKTYDKTNQSTPVAELLDEILAPDTNDGLGTDNMTC